MAYTILNSQIIAIQEFIHKSVLELRYIGLEEEEIIIQLPENHYKAILYFIDRSMSPGHKIASNAKVTFCGVEMHPIGYESKVVVYYKHVSYKNRDLIRTMDI